MSQEIANLKIELEACEEIIQNSMMAGGTALARIRDERLYREQYGTFEEYCQKRWGFSRVYGYRLINGAEVVSGLPKEVQLLIGSPAAAHELKNVPPPRRSETVKKAAEASKTGKATAKTIKENAPPPRKKKPEKPPADILLDSTGIPIPEETIVLWQKAHDEAKTFTAQMRAMSHYLEKIKAEENIVFVEMGKDINNDIAKIKAVTQNIELGIPFAVCPTCNGKIPKGCVMCKGRGFVSKFYWDTHVPQEVKDLRN